MDSYTSFEGSSTSEAPAVNPFALFPPLSSSSSSSSAPNPESVPTSAPFHFSAPSPRARTQSTASSASSFQSSSYLDTTSPDTSASTYNLPHDLQPPNMVSLSLDGNGRGFRVEESNVGGATLVEWDKLVQLLVHPDTVAQLPPQHPIAQASTLLASLPAPTFAHHPESVDAQPGEEDVEPLSARLGGFNFNKEESQGPGLGDEGDNYDSPQTAHPFRSNFPPFPLPRQPVPTSALPPIPPAHRLVDSRTFNSPPVALPPFPPNDDAALSLPVPPARLRRGDPDFGSSLTRRNTSSPCARPPTFYNHQHAHLSSSSLQDFAGSVPSSSAASFRSLNEVPPPRSLTKKAIDKKHVKGKRLLNGATERYVWSFHKAQLFRLADDAPRTADSLLEQGWDANGEAITLSMEEIVFPPKTYYRCFDNGREIFPCDATSRVNDFLRGQHCVPFCNFRFEGKRPSVIRHHVVSCKARAREIPDPDPLKRLCELQLQAQQNIHRQRRAHDQASETLSNDFGGQDERSHSSERGGEESDVPDDNRSIYSFESYESSSNLSTRRGHRPISFVDTSNPSSPRSEVDATKEEEPEGNWWSTRRMDSNDPIRAMLDASTFIPPDDPHSSTSTVESSQSLSKEPYRGQDWLMNYGLKTPTLRTALEQQQQQQQMALDSPRNSDSFLAMD